MNCKFCAIINGEHEISGDARKYFSYANCRFIEYHRNEQNEIDGATIACDLGHGYGFDNDEKNITLRFGEEYHFSHDYTDTSDGIWEDGFTSVRVKLLASEDEAEFYIGPIIPENWK